MEQPRRNSSAEHHRDQNENEQRHAEIEVLVYYADKRRRSGTADRALRRHGGQMNSPQNENRWGVSNSSNTLEYRQRR